MECIPSLAYLAGGRGAAGEKVCRTPAAPHIRSAKGVATSFAAQILLRLVTGFKVAIDR
jgi:hypothetical protein